MKTSFPFIVILILILILIGLAPPAHATPVYFPVAEMTGGTNDVTINVRAVNNPVIWNGSFHYLPKDGTNLTTVGGYVTNSFIPGNYVVTILGIPQSWTMGVTNTATLLNAVDISRYITKYSGIISLTGRNLEVTNDSFGNYWLTDTNSGGGEVTTPQLISATNLIYLAALSADAVSSNALLSLIQASGAASNVFFSAGQNTSWRTSGGSNVVDVTGTLTNNTTGNAATSSASTNAPDGNTISSLNQVTNIVNAIGGSGGGSISNGGIFTTGQLLMATNNGGGVKSVSTATNFNLRTTGAQNHNPFFHDDVSGVEIQIDNDTEPGIHIGGSADLWVDGLFHGGGSLITGLAGQNITSGSISNTQIAASTINSNRFDPPTLALLGSGSGGSATNTSNLAGSYVANVVDFGAVPYNGTNISEFSFITNRYSLQDNGAAIQAAFNAAFASRGATNTVFFPQGVYQCGTNIYVPPGISVKGVGLLHAGDFGSSPDRLNTNAFSILWMTNSSASSLCFSNLNVKGASISFIEVNGYTNPFTYGKYQSVNSMATNTSANLANGPGIFLGNPAVTDWNTTAAAGEGYSGDFQAWNSAVVGFKVGVKSTANSCNFFRFHMIACDVGFSTSPLCCGADQTVFNNCSAAGRSEGVGYDFYNGGAGRGIVFISPSDYQIGTWIRGTNFVVAAFGGNMEFTAPTTRTNFIEAWGSSVSIDMTETRVDFAGTSLINYGEQDYGGMGGGLHGCRIQDMASFDSSTIGAGLPSSYPVILRTSIYDTGAFHIDGGGTEGWRLIVGNYPTRTPIDALPMTSQGPTFAPGEAQPHLFSTNAWDNMNILSSYGVPWILKNGNNPDTMEIWLSDSLTGPLKHRLVMLGDSTSSTSNAAPNTLTLDSLTLNGTVIPSFSWTNLLNIPAGFADNVDDTGGAGGAATNAVTTVGTNNVNLSTAATNMQFFSGSGITVTGTNLTGKIGLVFANDGTLATTTIVSAATNKLDTDIRAASTLTASVNATNKLNTDLNTVITAATNKLDTDIRAASTLTASVNATNKLNTDLNAVIAAATNAATIYASIKSPLTNGDFRASLSFSNTVVFATSGIPSVTISNGQVTATTFSGALSSTSTASTASAGDNDTSVATTAFVTTAVANGTNAASIRAITAQQTNYATLISMLGPLTNGLSGGGGGDVYLANTNLFTANTNNFSGDLHVGGNFYAANQSVSNLYADALLKTNQADGYAYWSGTYLTNTFNASSWTNLPVATGISGLGTGIATALAVNTGSAGAPVLFNGALGTPTSGVLSSATGYPINNLTTNSLIGSGPFLVVSNNVVVRSNAPAGGSGDAVLSASQTWTGVNTLSNSWKMDAAHSLFLSNLTTARVLLYDTARGVTNVGFQVQPTNGNLGALSDAAWTVTSTSLQTPAGGTTLTIGNKNGDNLLLTGDVYAKGNGITNVPMATSVTIPMGAWFTNNVTVTDKTPASAVTATNSGDTFYFTDGVSNVVHSRFALPYDWNAGVVRVGLRAFCTGTNSLSLTNTVWFVRAAAIGNGDRPDNPTWGTAVYMTNGLTTNSWTSREGITGDITVGNTPTIAKSILWEIGRAGAASGDSLTNSSVALEEVRVYLQRSSATNWPTASP